MSMIINTNFLKFFLLNIHAIYIYKKENIKIKSLIYATMNYMSKYFLNIKCQILKNN